MGQGIKEDTLTFAQGIFRPSPVVLVGSGFSCSYGLPSMGELGAHLAAAVPTRLTTIDAKNTWAAAVADIAANLEHGLGTIPNSNLSRDEIVDAIRHETAWLILERLRAAEANILARTDWDSIDFVRLVRRLKNGSSQGSDFFSIITTNYDTLIELFCDIASVAVDTGFSGYRLRKPRDNGPFHTSYSRHTAISAKRSGYEYRPLLSARLFKPHGSITWNLRSGGPVELTNELSASNRAIVVPGPTKYQDALVSTLFDSIRIGMNGVVSRASSMFCIGFGFNDDHLEGVIRNRLSAGMPLLIITRDLTDSIRSVIDKHEKVLAICKAGDGSEIVGCGDRYEVDMDVWSLDGFQKKFLE